MKKYILSAALILMISILFAQPSKQQLNITPALLKGINLYYFPNDVPEQTEIYCELIAEQETFSSAFKISADYGQMQEGWVKKGIVPQTSFFSSWEKFSSIIDAFNYMNSLGWEYVTALPQTASPISGKTEYHFILRYRIKKS